MLLGWPSLWRGRDGSVALLTSHCRWGGMFRIWIFLLLQRQSPGLRSREGSDCRRLSGSKMVRP